MVPFQMGRTENALLLERNSAVERENEQVLSTC